MEKINEDFVLENIKEDCPALIQQGDVLKDVDLDSQAQWRTDSFTASIAIALMGDGTHAADLFTLLENKNFSKKKIQDCICVLLDQNILEEVARIGCGTVRNSAKFGWCDAYDHIRATWDYPFEDYSKGGQTVDKKRMQEYQATTPDLIRYLPPKGAPSLPLPDIKYALTKIDKSIFDDLPLEVKIPIVSSVAALPIKWAPSRSGGAAHMLRTSPSGGARHPSELYLLVINIPGFKQGVYHISIGTKDMRFMSDLPDNSIIRQQLPGAYRHPRALRGLWIDSAKVVNELLWELASKNITPHITPAFRDSILCQILGLPDDMTYLPVYAISFGAGDGANN